MICDYREFEVSVGGGGELTFGGGGIFLGGGECLYRRLLHTLAMFSNLRISQVLAHTLLS